jgi:hypothetical protein
MKNRTLWMKENRPQKIGLGHLAWVLFLEYGRGVIAQNSMGGINYLAPSMFEGVERGQIEEYKPALEFCFYKEMQTEEYGLLKMFAIWSRESGDDWMKVPRHGCPVFGFTPGNNPD